MDQRLKWKQSRDFLHQLSLSLSIDRENSFYDSSESTRRSQQLLRSSSSIFLFAGRERTSSVDSPIPRSTTTQTSCDLWRGCLERRSTDGQSARRAGRSCSGPLWGSCTPRRPLGPRWSRSSGVAFQTDAWSCWWCESWIESTLQMVPVTRPLPGPLEKYNYTIKFKIKLKCL